MGECECVEENESRMIRTSRGACPRHGSEELRDESARRREAERERDSADKWAQFYADRFHEAHEIASLALTTGLAECERLSGELAKSREAHRGAISELCSTNRVNEALREKLERHAEAAARQDADRNAILELCEVDEDGSNTVSTLAAVQALRERADGWFRELEVVRAAGVEFRDRYEAAKARVAELESQRATSAEVPEDVHASGWQWRPVGDGAFAPPFGTIRACRVCGCLVAGGPTACARCAETEEPRPAPRLPWKALAKMEWRICRDACDEVDRSHEFNRRQHQEIRDLHKALARSRATRRRLHEARATVRRMQAVVDAVYAYVEDDHRYLEDGEEGAYADLLRAVRTLFESESTTASAPPAASAAPHEYRSTACLHEKHDACRKACKFCEQPCDCDCHVDAPAPEPARRAAVALLERPDDKILCVWNRRYDGWSLPGGLVEEDETVEQALARELREETGLELLSAAPLFDGPHKTPGGVARGRGSHVHVFRVTASGLARQVEEGCPIRWMSKEAFLAESPFAEFYGDVFGLDAVPKCATCGGAGFGLDHSDRCVDCTAPKTAPVEQPAASAAPVGYVPKVGDRVRAVSTQGHPVETVEGVVTHIDSRAGFVSLNEPGDPDRAVVLAEWRRFELLAPAPEAAAVDDQVIADAVMHEARGDKHQRTRPVARVAPAGQPMAKPSRVTPEEWAHLREMQEFNAKVASDLADIRGKFGLDDEPMAKPEPAPVEQTEPEELVRRKRASNGDGFDVFVGHFVVAQNFSDKASLDLTSGLAEDLEKHVAQAVAAARAEERRVTLEEAAVIAEKVSDSKLWAESLEARVACRNVRDRIRALIEASR